MSSKIFLKSFTLVSEEDEALFMRDIKSTCYNTLYPYKIFSLKDFYDIEFAPITIFYGGNGCGKTTLLNVISEKLKLKRLSPFNVSPLFEHFVDGCSYEGRIPSKSRILTSDDVFDYLLNIRNLNMGIDTQREELFKEWQRLKNSSIDFDPLTSISEYDKWLDRAKNKKLSGSEFVRRKLGTNVDMYSNGESALKFWAEQIDSDALYLLDEPIAGVDPAARDYVIRTIINNYSPTSTVIISTHLIADVEQILSDFVFINKGQIVMEGSVAETRESKKALTNYLGRCLDAKKIIFA